MDEKGVMPTAMMLDVFGDPATLLESDRNPEYLYRQQKASGKNLPFLYLACGTEDHLLSVNRDFRDFLKKEKADYFYEEGPGVHNWTFWNEYIARGVKKVLSR